MVKRPPSGCTMPKLEIKRLMVLLIEKPVVQELVVEVLLVQELMVQEPVLEELSLTPVSVQHLEMK